MAALVLVVAKGLGGHDSGMDYAGLDGEGDQAAVRGGIPGRHDEECAEDGGNTCPLYTSDAADVLLCVGLGHLTSLIYDQSLHMSFSLP